MLVTAPIIIFSLWSRRNQPMGEEVFMSSNPYLLVAYFASGVGVCLILIVFCLFAFLSTILFLT